MGFRKCPRCELNYITDNETLCKVCKREIRGDDRLEVIDLCTVCNERPVMPGKDICLVCYKEMEENGELANEDENEPVDDETEIDSLDEADELLDDTDDIPAGELEEIENDLSLDEMGEEEDREDEEEDPFEE